MLELVRIDQITSEVTAGVQNDKPSAEATNVTVSGATIAGQAVGITDKGIVGLGSATALAPVIEQAQDAPADAVVEGVEEGRGHIAFVLVPGAHSRKSFRTFGVDRQTTSRLQSKN